MHRPASAVPKHKPHCQKVPYGISASALQQEGLWCVEFCRVVFRPQACTWTSDVRARYELDSLRTLQNCSENFAMSSKQDSATSEAPQDGAKAAGKLEVKLCLRLRLNEGWSAV